MTQLCIPLTAGTSFPNTPESDRRPRVMCNVEVMLLDGSTETARFMAADGGAAIDALKSMSDERFKSLTRVPSA